MHQLERTIDLDVSAAELWEFIATPANLNQLTPPDLDFDIVSSPPDRMFNGLIIEYRIAIPVIGRQRWLTEIKHIREGVSFVDEQRIGPYRLWYHYHEISPVSASRTRMVDRVHYRLPFGPLGVMIEALWVGAKLREIFDYRSKKLRELFPDKH